MVEIKNVTGKSHLRSIAAVARNLFRERLDAIIDLRHPLVRLAGLVPWSDSDGAFGRFYKPLGYSGCCCAKVEIYPIVFCKILSKSKQLDLPKG